MLSLVSADFIHRLHRVGRQRRAPVPAGGHLHRRDSGGGVRGSPRARAGEHLDTLLDTIMREIFRVELFICYDRFFDYF